MGKMLHQPPQSRRFQLHPRRLVLLLLVPAAALALRAVTRERGTEPQPSGTAGVNPSRTVAEPRLSLRDIPALPDWIPSHNHALLGRQAPDFALADPDGKVWNLRELRAGGSLVLIFYYGYHCPNCVRQLRKVNSDLPLFGEVGARVVAISADPPELTRQRFDEYGRFDFLVLSDPATKVAHAYRALRGNLLRHGIFLIDRDGRVAWVNVGDAPFWRNSALLCQLASMEGRLPSQDGVRIPVSSPAPRIASEPAVDDGRDCGATAGVTDGAKRSRSPQR
jgi:peroxiredoxin